MSLRTTSDGTERLDTVLKCGLPMEEFTLVQNVFEFGCLELIEVGSDLFNQIAGSWAVVTISQAGQESPTAGVSTYYCYR